MLINKITLKGERLLERGAYWKAGAKSNHYSIQSTCGWVHKSFQFQLTCKGCIGLFYINHHFYSFFSGRRRWGILHSKYGGQFGLIVKHTKHNDMKQKSESLNRPYSKMAAHANLKLFYMHNILD